MNKEAYTKPHNMDEFEVQEWLESLDSVLESSGPEVAAEILERLRAHATVSGIDLPFTANTPYANTIPVRLEPLFPGDQELERRIKSLIRWNALAMVVRANREEHNIGGHISTYASAATLYEVGFNHFFRARTPEFEGDTIYFQGLDGPVRGNGQIIQELESAFRGARWNVIKVLWGSEWDPILERDTEGLLVKRMGELVDGEYQKLVVSSGAYVRQHFFGHDERLLKLVEPLPDEALRRLRLGGHDPRKVYAAYKAATEHRGGPTVILARTIKGYGLGEAGEGKNVTHQQKKLNEDELKEFRSRFGIPLNDQDCIEVPFYRPSEDSPEIQYLRARREVLGGYTPARAVRSKPITTDNEELFKEFHDGSEGREVSTTMAF